MGPYLLPNPLKIETLTKHFASGRLSRFQFLELQDLKMVLHYDILYKWCGSRVNAKSKSRCGHEDWKIQESNDLNFGLLVGLNPVS